MIFLGGDEFMRIDNELKYCWI